MPYRVAVIGLAVATLLAVIMTWPGARPGKPAPGQRLDTVSATVLAVSTTDCPVDSATPCTRAKVKITSGDDAGTTSTFLVGVSASDVEIQKGDTVRLVKSEVEQGAVAGVEIEPYGFSDFERLGPLTWLVVLFAFAVIATGRWRGVRALVGLGVSVLVILLYIVPALLIGETPILIATVGALAVMFVTIPLAHGWSATTVAAILGTTAALVLTIALATFFIQFAMLSGFASEEASYLAATATEVSIRGLLLAGIVIATLGVLDDVTVTQASTVIALRRANPTYGIGELARRALDVGRDHITATVNTLVLAYAGASLPALLVFAVADVRFGTALNGEAVASEVIAMLVGSIGLMAAMPITTYIAALLAHAAPAESFDTEPHAHSHSH